MSGFALIKYTGAMPNVGRLDLGHQNDRPHPQAVAVAETKWGKIPGKAEGGTCWYSYDGKENTTNDFYYVIADPPTIKQVPNAAFSSPPAGALCVGYQSDGSGHQYAAIAKTPQGTIPGKAKDNTCWYPYGGKEHTTNNFAWLVYQPR